jgi:hypothetical protein
VKHNVKLNNIITTALAGTTDATTATAQFFSAKHTTKNYSTNQQALPPDQIASPINPRIAKHAKLIQLTRP